MDRVRGSDAARAAGATLRGASGVSLAHPPTRCVGLWGCGPQSQNRALLLDSWVGGLPLAGGPAYVAGAPRSGHAPLRVAALASPAHPPRSTLNRCPTAPSLRAHPTSLTLLRPAATLQALGGAQVEWCLSSRRRLAVGGRSQRSDLSPLPIWPLSALTTPVLRPVSELSRSPYFLTCRADSRLSLTQRPASAAICEPACATTAPVPATYQSRRSPRSFADSPSAARKRSTSAAFPITASPSPSPISWISLSIDRSPNGYAPLGVVGRHAVTPGGAESFRSRHSSPKEQRGQAHLRLRDRRGPTPAEP